MDDESTRFIVYKRYTVYTMVITMVKNRVKECDQHIHILLNNRLDSCNPCN